MTLTPIAYLQPRHFAPRAASSTQSVGATPAPYDTAETDGDVRVVAAAPQRPVEPPPRLGRRGSSGAPASARRASTSNSLRTEFTDGDVSRTLEDERPLAATPALTSSLKLIAIDLRGPQPRDRRRDRDRTAATTSARCCRTACRCSAEFGDNLSASSLRLAAYAQDEWNLTPNWAAHAGLRWEAIATRGSGRGGQPEARNRSSVWTPLLHAVWKPDPKGRDQVRISLTRSYRSPTLAT